MTDPQISLALAFAAGIVSFLSPCVLPVVPSWVSFVTGFTLEELADGTTASARREAVVHALLFGAGFGLVFVSLGAAATAFGQALNRALPLFMRVGGVVVVVFGLHLTGAFRIGALARERRIHLARRPGGRLGSVVVGAAFGAGWTPCIGPILGTILLYASLEETVVRGAVLLGAYSVGLALPFLFAAVGLNWYLAGMERAKRWIGPLERIAGAILIVVGATMVTGHFADLSRHLAGLGQWLDLGGALDGALEAP